MTDKAKQIIGEPLVINGRTLSLSRAVKAGNTLYLTGQIPMKDGAPMTDGSIEEQTRSCIENIRDTLQLAGCDLSNVVKTTVWLKDREDFPGFDETFLNFHFHLGAALVEVRRGDLPGHLLPYGEGLLP